MKYLILIKIGKIEHLKQIQEGKLYINNLQFYIDLEKINKEKGMGDVTEGALATLRKFQCLVEDEDGNIIYTSSGELPGTIYDERSLHCPTFCMMYKEVEMLCDDLGHAKCSFQLSNEEIEDFISEDSECGALIIYLPEVFLNKINNAADKRNVKVHWGKVDYRNKKIPNIKNGEWILDDIFTKDDSFKYQSEYRIVFEEYCDKPERLNIGNIEDITYLLDAQQLNKKITIQFDNVVFDD